MFMDNFKKHIFKLLEKNEGQVLRYRILFLACMLVHSFLIFLFARAGLTFLFCFNILSVLMYFIGLVFAKAASKTPISIILMYLEIVVHAVICNYMLDWSYSFALYSLLVIPISYYLAYMQPKIANPSRFGNILAIINLSVMAFSVVTSDGEMATFDTDFSKFVSSFNFIISALVITIFSAIYLYEINSTLGSLSLKNDELNFLAVYDPLTKLRNRQHIAEVFSDFEKGTNPFCVILGDIDDFKRINDTYSHDCGDKVLVTVSEIIRKHIADKGVVCRWGGEEILLIVSGKNEDCIELVERIRLEIQNQQMSFGIKQINVTMTFGFTDYSEAMNIEKLVSIADKRLYEGKRNGKNQIVYK